MQDLYKTVHSVQVVAWTWNENEEDGDLSNLRKVEERLPDVYSRL